MLIYWASYYLCLNPSSLSKQFPTGRFKHESLYAADKDEQIGGAGGLDSAEEQSWCGLKAGPRWAIGCLARWWRDTNFWTLAKPPLTPETIMGSPVYGWQHSPAFLYWHFYCRIEGKIGADTSAGQALEGCSNSRSWHSWWHCVTTLHCRGWHNTTQQPGVNEQWLKDAVCPVA